VCNSQHVHLLFSFQSVQGWSECHTHIYTFFSIPCVPYLDTGQEIRDRSVRVRSHEIVAFRHKDSKFYGHWLSVCFTSHFCKVTIPAIAFLRNSKNVGPPQRDTYFNGHYCILLENYSSVKNAHTDRTML
jgi:hypothetical protein